MSKPVVVSTIAEENEKGERSGSAAAAAGLRLPLPAFGQMRAWQRTASLRLCCVGCIEGRIGEPAGALKIIDACVWASDIAHGSRLAKRRCSSATGLCKGALRGLHTQTDSIHHQQQQVCHHHAGARGGGRWRRRRRLDLIIEAEKHQQCGYVRIRTARETTMDTTTEGEGAAVVGAAAASDDDNEDDGRVIRSEVHAGVTSVRPVCVD